MPRSPDKILEYLSVGDEIYHDFDTGVRVRARVEEGGKITLVAGYPEDLDAQGKLVYASALSAAKAVYRGLGGISANTFWKFEGRRLAYWKAQASKPTPIDEDGPPTHASVQIPVEQKKDLIKELDRQMSAFIESVVKTYERESHRYRQVIDLVRLDVEEIVGRGSVIAVTDRVKSSDSLRGKLQKYWEECQEEQTQTGEDADSPLHKQLKSVGSGLEQGIRFNARMPGVILSVAEAESEGALELDGLVEYASPQQRVLNAVPDLAGLRVLAYRLKDLEGLVTDFKSYWPDVEEGASGTTGDASIFLIDHKSHGPYLDHDNPAEYAAEHFRIVVQALSESSQAHLDDARCEIQVTTATRHVLNEVMHAVRYKNQDGKAKDPADALIVFPLAEQDRNLERMFGHYGHIPKRLTLKERKEQSVSITELIREPREVDTRAGKYRAQELRKQIGYLMAFAEETKHEGARKILESKHSLNKAVVAAGYEDPDNLLELASRYNSLFEPVEAAQIENSNGTLRLDPKNPDDMWMLKILAVLPDGFLQQFCSVKGQSRGQRSLVFRMAEALGKLR